MFKDKKLLFIVGLLIPIFILSGIIFGWKFKNPTKPIQINPTVIDSNTINNTDYDLVLLPSKESPKGMTLPQELYARYPDGRMEKIFNYDQLRKQTPYGKYLFVLYPGIPYGNLAYLQSNDSQQLYTFDKIKKIFLDNSIGKYTFGPNLERLIFSSDYKKAVIRNYHYFAVADLEKGFIINLFSVPQDYELTPVDDLPDYHSNPSWVSDTKFQIVISPKNNYKEQKIIIIDTQEQAKNDQPLYLDYNSRSLFSKNKDGVKILKTYIGDKEGVNFFGDEIEQNKIDDFHYFDGNGSFFGYSNSKNEFYFIPTSTVPEDVSMAGSAISENQSVAIFLKYHDGKERVVILSPDLQKVIFEKYLETNFTFIFSEDFYYTIGDATKWLDKNVIRIALYDKDIPIAPPPRDCDGCDGAGLRGFADSVISEQEAFKKAVNDRKPIKFIDIKIK